MEERSGAVTSREPERSREQGQDDGNEEGAGRAAFQV